jgi:hypothetical protein
MPKDKPLLVSGPLIQPVRTGSKTETRRLNGLDWLNELPDSWEFVGLNGKTASFQKYEGKLTVHVNCPYGEHGATIWVRENWYTDRTFNDLDAAGLKQIFDHPAHALAIGFAADGRRPEWAGRIRPSIHMPKWICRTFLEVVFIRVERLHQIKEQDAYSEGFTVEMMDEFAGFEYPGRTWFMNTWKNLNGPESWDLNPWVWVVSFKLKTQ